MSNSPAPGFFEMVRGISEKELEFYLSLDSDTKAKLAALETAKQKQQAALQSLMLFLRIEHPINFINFGRDQDGPKVVLRFDPALASTSGTSADASSQPGASGISADPRPQTELPSAEAQAEPPSQAAATEERLDPGLLTLVNPADTSSQSSMIPETIGDAGVA